MCGDDRDPSGPARLVRRRIDVRGIVQGVGFRPFVYRLATELELRGWVCNDARGVVIEVEGPRSSVRRFTEELTTQAPPLAVLDTVQSVSIPPTGARAFTIRPSDAQQDGFAPISPDIATCPDCLRELFDPSDRRHRYPFINCTNCGPHLTIVEGVPYDRPRTTMKKFPLCRRCRAEYENPSDRRFHAQPNACPSCGPRLWLSPSPGTAGVALTGDAALLETRRLLARGHVLAIKGLGGFHLACDATNRGAVASLRSRKGRPHKPFAVMVRDLEAARRICQIDDHAAALLSSPRRPIVLLEGRADTSVAPEVAPGLRRLGVMLPYTPLHHLILEQRDTDDPAVLVMTSGNRSEEPIAVDNDEALERLGELADYFLLHDRDIGVRCDDSVAVVQDGQPSVIRRARGYAPFPLRLPMDVAETLACGGELKNAFCLASQRYAFLSQHIGDLENAETLAAFEEGVERYKTLFRLAPRVVAYDLHPDYLASRYAQERGRRDPSLRLVAAQHHHAHMASCMAENGLDGPVIGVIWDGAGYGLDGAVWGGEFLVGGYRTVERMAHLSYVAMPGGDAATRRPSRMALSYLRHALSDRYRDVARALLPRFDALELEVVDHLLATGLNAPPTSSAGRLFDGVAALLGVRDVVTYEGQAAVELEQLADERDLICYPIALRAEADEGPGDQPWVIDVAPTIRSIVEELDASVERSIVAARFHNTLAAAVGRVCAHIRDRTGLERVVLSGGVFQNQLLLRRTMAALRESGLQVYIQTAVPCNDGGLALGQVMIAHALCAEA